VTRGWVCRIQFLLVLASAVILGSESWGTHNRILLPQIRDPPTWRVSSSYLYPPGTRWPSYNPKHWVWVLFSSPPTTHRVTVAVFEPVSTREADCIRVESYVTTDGQSTSLSWNKAYDQIFITVWQLRGSWYGALSLTRGRVCRFQLLLVLASAVILGSESQGTLDYILLSQIWDVPFRRLLRLAGLRWRYSTPPPHGSDCALLWTATCTV
jgi:hypothetical protein